MTNVNLSEVPLPADKRLTMIFHPGNVNIAVDKPDTVLIDPERTMACAKAIDAEAWAYLKAQPRFQTLMRFVFGEEDFPDLFTETYPLQAHGSGVRHVVGLILLLLDARRQGKSPYIRMPETHLHPRQQLGLADLFLHLTKG